METKDQIMERLEGESRLREMGRLCELALAEQGSRGSNGIGSKVVRFEDKYGARTRDVNFRCHGTNDRFGYSSSS